MRITIYGTLQYRKGRSAKRPDFPVQYSNRKIISPTMTAKAFSSPKCNGSGKDLKLSKADLYQRWYAADCAFNPGVSVGVPWTITVAPTLSCGNVTAAQRKTQFSASAASYRQSNSGKEIKFDGTKVGKAACVSVDGTVQAYKKNAADNADVTFKVCPS